eukprot:CAMPEP_0196574070 /NCGR_PEP_ID=MMETSP1081-20130531/3855_1 /TAXON_ID=36882 /ORGANISM="Pyramimonas amylifera, Strain CCMP720" /LENGTH=291 /DNA_ID=CAMNT_0041891971 /DNA_START=148 /DNA_END=1023 /DNA_ORIENTATION=-
MNLANDEVDRIRFQDNNSNNLKSRILLRSVACRTNKLRQVSATVVDSDDDWKDNLSLNSTQRGVCAALWVALLTAATFGTNPATDPEVDAALISLLTTPGHFFSGEVNPLFEAEWYSFGFVLVIYLSLLMPGAQDQKPLPTVPFVVASGALGWFVLAPYMTLREIREEPITKSDVGFVTRNILENKIFAGINLASAWYVLTNVIGNSYSGMFGEYSSLVSTQALATISTFDISIMSLMMYFPMVEDMKRRGWEDKTVMVGMSKNVSIAVAFTAIPIFGPLLYLFVRPQLED